MNRLSRYADSLVGSLKRDAIAAERRPREDELFAIRVLPPISKKVGWGLGSFGEGFHPPCGAETNREARERSPPPPALGGGVLRGPCASAQESVVSAMAAPEGSLVV